MISRVSIKNFKSLKDEFLDTGPLTTLIGPTGSGKSNILDAFRFVKDAFCETDAETDRVAQVETALNKRGGFERVVSRGDADARIEFEIEFDVDLGYMRQTVEFSAEIARAEDGGLEVCERVRPTYPTTISEAESEWFENLPRRAFAAWRFYDLSPALMRKPAPIRREFVLNESGSNLSSVIHTLYAAEHPILPDLEGSLKAMLPSVKRLAAPVVDGDKIRLALEEKGLPHPVDARSLSDGTLRCLALTVALAPVKQARLICVETPEADIHPSNRQAVANMFEAASYYDTQAVIATQSTRLIDWLPPESLTVVQKNGDGETRIHPVKDDSIALQFISEAGAGDAWNSGGLEEEEEDSL